MMKQSIKHKSRRFRRFLKANEAVSALEYAILVGVVTVALVGLFTTFNADMKTAVEKISDNIKTKTKDVGKTVF